MNPILQEYIESHIDSQPEYLDKVERQTNLRLINGRMCSGHLQGRILKMLTQMIRPHRVLELGSFSGFSALCIAEGLPAGATIDTVEVDDELEDFILSNFSMSPFADRISLHIGDAIAIASQFPDSTFDMIFMDADKRQYRDYYSVCMRILRPGGFLIADNTLWDGHVVDPAKARDPQTHGIMEFNNLVASDPRMEKVIIPIRDGLTLIRKLQ